MTDFGKWAPSDGPLCRVQQRSGSDGALSDPWGRRLVSDGAGCRPPAVRWLVAVRGSGCQGVRGSGSQGFRGGLSFRGPPLNHHTYGDHRSHRTRHGPPRPRPVPYPSWSYVCAQRPQPLLAPGRLGGPRIGSKQPTTRRQRSQGLQYKDGGPIISVITSLTRISRVRRVLSALPQLESALPIANTTSPHGTVITLPNTKHLSIQLIIPKSRVSTASHHLPPVPTHPHFPPWRR